MKIGIIGVGYAGQLHSKAIEMINLDVTYYVYDITVRAAKEFAKSHKCQAVDTLEELYNRVDAIIIATPTFTHFNLAMEAMQKGKHILCEKPMSLKMTEAEEMLAMCKKENLICMIGFNYRFFEITEILKKQNQVGKIYHIRIAIKRLFRRDWHNENNGVLSDLGIHLIDYVMYLCEQKINLSTCEVKRKYIEDWDYDSNIVGKTEKGISFELTASRIEKENDVQFNIEVIGTNGIFRYDSRQETTYIIEKNNVTNKYNFNKTQNTEGFFDFTDSILRQDETWIKAMSGEDIKEIATFEDGFCAQKVLEHFISKNGKN